MIGRPEDMFREEAQRECNRVAEKLVHAIKSKAPEQTGQYKAGFFVIEDLEGAWVVNEPGLGRPGNLWEMLEYGHDIADKNGKTVGHKGPQPHIRPAIEEVRAELKK